MEGSCRSDDSSKERVRVGVDDEDTRKNSAVD